MNIFFKQSLIALSCSAALFLTGCNDDNNDDFNVSTDKNFVSEKSYSKDSIAEASSVKVMTYNMPNVLGKTKEATAMVFVP